jgi:subtilisin family serine protease
LDRIDQHRLRNGMYNYIYTGAGVHVYVIDSGILPTHSDFGNRASIAADFVNDGHNGWDCNGHGTHVAGIVGGATYGVAKGVTLHGVRVLDCSGWAPNSRVIAGVDWVTGNKTFPAVANISWGADADPSLDTAVRNSIAQGITYVVSAGNNNFDAGFYSPGRVAEAITVAASSLVLGNAGQDVRADFSNFGPSVDIFAPGDNIESDWKDGSTAVLSGTSQASPHVAGVAALYLQTHPSATPAMVSNAITNAATKNVVQNPGAGTPNNFLYVTFPAATVTITGQEQHACKIESDTNECIGIVFDSDTVSVTVNGRSYTTPYGKLSLAKNIASALAASINTDPDVSASVSGTVISILSRFGCYTLSGSSTTSLPQYFDPSFSGTVSGPVCP